MNGFTSFEAYRSRSEHVLAQLESCSDVISVAADLCWAAIERGGTIVWCGNGGSAAEAQHMAAELVGRFAQERSAIRSIAITTDSSILTALANDYSYEFVFERQVEALVRTGDVLVGLSTSGRSANVLAGITAARRMGAKTVALTGRGPTPCSLAADVAIEVDDDVTSHIQEAHLVAAHYLCLQLEERWVQARMADTE